MSNRKLNVILIAIGGILLIILFNVFYLYKRNESSKVNFNENEFLNTTWVSDKARLEFKDSKLSFKIDDNEVISSNYTFNNRTGEFVNDDSEFYLRSINEYSIIVWYNRGEYNLEKEVIAR